MEFDCFARGIPITMFLTAAKSMFLIREGTVASDETCQKDMFTTTIRFAKTIGVSGENV